MKRRRKDKAYRKRNRQKLENSIPDSRNKNPEYRQKTSNGILQCNLINMSQELTTYTRHYQIFIKDVKDPIEISAK